MASSKIITFLLTNLIYVNSQSININNFHEVEGYYWRDYTGKIPKDALLGGTDDRGRTTYIGQTLHPGVCILPGKISELDKKMFYEYGGAERTAVQDVKILCSKHPEKLEWISVKNKDKLSSIKGREFVMGGHDKDRPLLIGRFTTANGKLALGKVLVLGEEFQLIYVANEGQTFVNGGPYEVLVYDPTPVTHEHSVGHGNNIININLW